MALNYNLVNSLVQERYLPGFADNIYNSSALLAALRNDQAVSIEGGERITAGLLYAKNTARGTFAGYDTVDVTPQDTRNRARYEWANYYVSVSLSQDDEDKVNGPDAVGTLLENSLKEAELSMKDQMATDIYTGIDANGIVGLASAVNTTNTYGGISGGSYSWWRSTVNTDSHTIANLKTASSTSYFWTLLGTAFAACTNGGGMPNLVVVGLALFNVIEAINIAQQQYQMLGVRSKALAANGFPVIEYRGVPIIADEFCPAYHCYVLNTKYLSMYVHSRSTSSNFRFSGFKNPTNQLARVGQITWKGQLGINNRRMFYKFTNMGDS
jgi:hypothetical protein